MKIVYTYVVADMFHPGHLNVLIQAKALGDYLIVGVLTEKAVIAYKRKPIWSYEDRKFVVENIKCVDMVVEQDDVDPTETIKKLDKTPDILTHGDDWDDDFPGAKYMREIGKEVQRVKYIKGFPTSDQVAFLQGYERRREDEKAGINTE